MLVRPRGNPRAVCRHHPARPPQAPPRAARASRRRPVRDQGQFVPPWPGPTTASMPPLRQGSQVPDHDRAGGGMGGKPKVVVVGSGFAGFFAARTLEKLLPEDAADADGASARPTISVTARCCRKWPRAPRSRRIGSHCTAPCSRAPDHAECGRGGAGGGTSSTGDRRELWLRRHTCRSRTTDWSSPSAASPSTFPDARGLNEHALGLKTLGGGGVHPGPRASAARAGRGDRRSGRPPARLTFVGGRAGYAGTERTARSCNG